MSQKEGLIQELYRELAVEKERREHLMSEFKQ